MWTLSTEAERSTWTSLTPRQGASPSPSRRSHRDWKPHSGPGRVSADQAYGAWALRAPAPRPPACSQDVTSVSRLKSCIQFLNSAWGLQVTSPWLRHSDKSKLIISFELHGSWTKNWLCHLRRTHSFYQQVIYIQFLSAGYLYPVQKKRQVGTCENCHVDLWPITTYAFQHRSRKWAFLFTDIILVWNNSVMGREEARL